jgi:hypothetical protein
MSLLANVNGRTAAIPAAPRVYDALAAVPVSRTRAESLAMEPVALTAGADMFNLYRVVPPPILGNPLSTQVLMSQMPPRQMMQYPPMMPAIGGALSAGVQPYSAVAPRWNPRVSRSGSGAGPGAAQALASSNPPPTAVYGLPEQTYDPHITAGNDFAAVPVPGPSYATSLSSVVPIPAPSDEDTGTAGTGSDTDPDGDTGDEFVPPPSSTFVFPPSSGGAPSEAPFPSPSPAPSPSPSSQGVLPGRPRRPRRPRRPNGSNPNPTQYGPGGVGPGSAPYPSPYPSSYPSPYPPPGCASGTGPGGAVPPYGLPYSSQFGRVPRGPLMGFDPEPALPLPLAFSRAYGYPYGPYPYPYGPIGLYEAGLLPVPSPMPVTTIGRQQFIDSITNGLAYGVRPGASTLKDATPVGVGLGVPPPCNVPCGYGCDPRYTLF